MTVGDGVDPPGFISRDAYGAGMSTVSGTIVRLSLVVITAQGVRNKAENINLRTLREHQTCVTVARSPPIVSPEMGKLAVMVGQFPGI